MKVLMLITGLGMGGAERQVCDLLDVMASKGTVVKLVCLAGPVDVVPSTQGIPVVNLNLQKSPWGLLAAASRFRKLVREFQPDVIHSHLVHANLFGRLMRIGLGVPVVISSAHNTDEEGWWRMWGYRMTDHLADLSTNVSAEAVDAFKQGGALGRKGMRVVYNGISTQRFQFNESARDRVRAELGVSPEEQLILNVGRLAPQKNQVALLKAFAALHDHKPARRLAIVGKGPLESELRALALRLGLQEDKIQFLGMRTDVDAVMSAADLFVLSSAWEGFGLVVAEAMACERVVVATDCGGVREVVGNTGFLISSRSDGLLAEAMLRALTMAEPERRELGAKARERVLDMFSIDAAADAWLGIYCELTKPKATAGETC